MASIKPDKKLRAPVLDRLLDHHPEQKLEPEYTQHLVLRQLRESVRRDLEHLFNTRARCLSTPEGSTELEASLLNYGLPDIANYNLMSSESRREFCRDVERIILRFEPRIRNVRVLAAGSVDPSDYRFSFRVEAVLRAAPAAEVLVFDSVLNPISQTVDVLESNR